MNKITLYAGLTCASRFDMIAISDSVNECNPRRVRFEKGDGNEVLVLNKSYSLRLQPLGRRG
jgi:hypothetical protein